MASRQARWQAKKRAQRLCIICGNPVEAGRIRCPFHLAQKAARQRRERVLTKQGK